MQRRIIERLSGVSFAEFVEKEMLKPCKMKSSVVDPDVRGDENIAVSFNNKSIEDAWQFTYPMYGWTSLTTRDLDRWTECLHNGKRIDRRSLIQILQPFEPGKQAGLGSGYAENGVLKEHYHQGTSSDFEALLYSEIAPDITIILLTNNKNFKVYEIKVAINNVLAGKTNETPKKSGAK